MSTGRPGMIAELKKNTTFRHMVAASSRLRHGALGLEVAPLEVLWAPRPRYHAIYRSPCWLAVKTARSQTAHGGGGGGNGRAGRSVGAVISALLLPPPLPLPSPLPSPLLSPLPSPLLSPLPSPLLSPLPSPLPSPLLSLSPSPSSWLLSRLLLSPSRRCCRCCRCRSLLQPPLLTAAAAAAAARRRSSSWRRDLVGRARLSAIHPHASMHAHSQRQPPAGMVGACWSAAASC